MLRRASLIFILVMLAGNLYAQDISGNWQGTIKVGRGLRLIMRIAKDDTGSWSATLFSPDQSPDWDAGAPATTVSLQGSEQGDRKSTRLNSSNITLSFMTRRA